MRVRAWETLPTPNFVKKSLKGIYPFAANLHKNYQFWRLWGPKVHIFKAERVTFGVMVRTWETLPHAKFYKNRLRGLAPLGADLYQSPYFDDLGWLKPHF